MTLTDIGAALRAARKAKGLTQQQVAEAVGLSRPTLSMLESGEVVELGVRKVMAVAQHLGLELSVAERRPYPTLDQLRNKRGR
jgi:transcriptional regulator with XRE-family HTH domain